MTDRIARQLLVLTGTWFGCLLGTGVAWVVSETTALGFWQAVGGVALGMVCFEIVDREVPDA